MRIWLLASAGLTAGALALTLPGCDSSADQKVALAKLASKCRINSDCGSPLVCVFERCHEECETSRDCDAGSRCVQSPQRRNVCQLPDEQACDAAGACPGDQVCGVDGECRDACRSSGECVAEQICSAGTCADIAELDDEGRLETAEERPTTFTPCTFDSDCPAREVCAAGACRAECQLDAECAETERCVEQACEPLAVTKPCLRNSDCATDQACLAGECRTVPPEPEPACHFDSDCRTPGQHCDQGQCVCECSTAADCGLGQTCQEGCACAGGRIIEGDVRIQNDRDLELIQDVVEITGRLELQMAGAAVYQLPHLRKVGAFSASGTGGSVRLDGLEELAGPVHCFQECQLPRLRHAGDLSLSSAAFRIIDLPLLETVSGSLHLHYCSNLTELRLPKLERTRDLRVQADVRLTKLDIPKLESLENLSIGGNDRLQTISLPLAAPSFSVDIGSNPALEALSLPSLESLGGSFAMWNNARLASVELPALARANELNLQTMPSLRSVSLPALATVAHSLLLASTSGPQTLTLPALASAGSFGLSDTRGIKAILAPVLATLKTLVVTRTELEVIQLPLRTLTGQLSLSDNPQLRTLELAALESADWLALSKLPALSSMNLSSLETTNDILITETGLTNLSSLHAGAGGALKSAGDLQIGLNPALPVCAVDVLTAKLSSHGWAGSVLAYDNLTCECEGAACL